MEDFLMTQKPAALTIILDGKSYECAGALRERLGVGECALYMLSKKAGFPKPLRLSRTRYFPVAEVDNWFLNQRR
jgi:hypothetical protein